MDAYKGHTNPAQRSGSSQVMSPAGVRCQELASLIFQLTTHVNTFKRLVDSLGSPKDTQALRARLSASRDSIQQMARETSTGLKEINNQITEGDADGGSRTYHAKLVRDFHAVLKEFQKAQRMSLDRECMYLPQEEPQSARGRMMQSRPYGSGAPPGDAELANMAGSNESVNASENAPLLAEHVSRAELVRLDGEMEYNDAMIAERDAGITEIHEQIQEVNEIFQDLAVLVSDQGTMLDDIEANIVRTAVKTSEATGELKKAEKSQRSSRNKMCCLFIFFVVVLVILILVLIKL